MKNELLILRPRGEYEDREPNWYRCLANLVLDEIDFAFDDAGDVPVDLPDDLSSFDNVVIFTEELPLHIDRLRIDFPEVDKLIERCKADGNPYRFATAARGGTRLFIRPLSALRSNRAWTSIYWAAHLTLPSPAFRQRQLKRSDELVTRQLIDRIVDAAKSPLLSSRDTMPRSRMHGSIMGEKVGWCEASGEVQRAIMDLADLTDNDALWQVGEKSLRRYLDETDWNVTPPNGDPWSIMETAVQVYERTKEADLLRFIQIRLEQRDAHWQLLNGCFGLWPEDQWLRDSTTSTMVVPAVRAAKFFPAEFARVIYDQAAHQAAMCEQLLRDDATGLYYFGADDERHSPTVFAHGSYWHIHTFANLLTHLPTTHRGHAATAAIFTRLANALANVQGDDGLWRPQLIHPECGVGDIVYSGVILASLFLGLTLGVLDRATFEPLCRKGLDGVKLRNYSGLAAGGTVACGLSPSPRYFFERPNFEELHFGGWQQIVPFVESLRYEQRRGAG